MVMSFGAEVIIEKTCFLANGGGKKGHPIVLAKGSGQNFTDGLNNYVEGTSECFVADLVNSSDVSCRSQDADAAECQASNLTFNAFW